MKNWTNRDWGWLTSIFSWNYYNNRFDVEIK